MENLKDWGRHVWFSLFLNCAISTWVNIVDPTCDILTLVFFFQNMCICCTHIIQNIFWKCILSYNVFSIAIWCIFELWTVLSKSEFLNQTVQKMESCLTSRSPRSTKCCKGICTGMEGVRQYFNDMILLLSLIKYNFY